jgi:hypothetical protein
MTDKKNNAITFTSRVPSAFCHENGITDKKMESVPFPSLGTPILKAIT